MLGSFRCRSKLAPSRPLPTTMPELPEVETTRRGIAPHLTGGHVSRVLIRNPRLRQPIPADLADIIGDRTLHAIKRRAKYLLLVFEHGTLLMHLGMSGSLRVIGRDTPPGKHDHIDIEFGDRVLRLHDPRRFGLVLWQQGSQAHPLLARLGIEPLDTAFDGHWLYEASRGRTTPAKLFIMDGKHIVGVGNIYASESLHAAGIDPRTPIGALGPRRTARLAEAIRRTLQVAIDAGGSTLRDFVHSDGKPGYFQHQHQVYGRAGQPCARCGNSIRVIQMGQRSTYFCPTCQRR